MEEPSITIDVIGAQKTTWKAGTDLKTLDVMLAIQPIISLLGVYKKTK